MSVYNRPAKAFATLLDKTSKRVAKGRAKVKKNQYGPPEFFNDVAGSWFDGVQAWIDLTTGGGATAPVCFISGAVGGQASGILSLTDAIDSNNLQQLKPDLVGVKSDGSGASVIAKNRVTFAWVDQDTADEILVTVNLQNAVAAQYQGLVVDGQQLLGTIILQVT